MALACVLSGRGDKGGVTLGEQSLLTEGAEQSSLGESLQPRQLPDSVWSFLESPLPLL